MLSISLVILYKAFLESTNLVQCFLVQTTKLRVCYDQLKDQNTGIVDDHWTLLYTIPGTLTVTTDGEESNSDHSV